MSYLGGLVGQAGRNVTLEPWRGNSRSEDGGTRWGEVTSDVGFIAGGGAAGVVGIRSAIHGGGVLPKIGWGLLAGVGVIAAATGVKNLFAKLPSQPEPPTPTPPTTEPPTSQPPTSQPPTSQPPTTEPPVPEPPATQTPSTTAPEATAPVGAVPTSPTTHTVKPGEYLAFIADCYDVDWRALYDVNRDVIGANPDQLTVGMSLQIPSKDYQPAPFAYHPSFQPGGAIPNLECDPQSPKAQRQACAPS